MSFESNGHMPVGDDGRVVKVDATPLVSAEESNDRYLAARPITLGGSKQPPFRWEWAALPGRGLHDRAGQAYLGERLVIYVEYVLLPDRTYSLETEEACLDYVEPDNRLPCYPNCQPGTDHTGKDSNA